jgi:hypothetical protein
MVILYRELRTDDIGDHMRCIDSDGLDDAVVPKDLCMADMIASSRLGEIFGENNYMSVLERRRRCQLRRHTSCEEGESRACATADTAI